VTTPAHPAIAAARDFRNCCVVAREVTLLLSAVNLGMAAGLQSVGASIALRKLVEQARLGGASSRIRLLRPRKRPSASCRDGFATSRNTKTRSAVVLPAICPASKAIARMPAG